MKGGKLGGLSRHPLYQVWWQMVRRCTDQNHAAWDSYGGRGITVCDRWRDSFPSFLMDMGERPSGMTIERIDNDRPYAPGNCRWASWTEQNRNKRNVRLVPGTNLTVPQAAHRAGIAVETLRSRIEKGWPRDLWLVPARAAGRIAPQHNVHDPKTGRFAPASKPV